MKSYKYSEKMVKFVTYFRIKIMMISRRLIIVLTAALMGMGLSMNAQDMREAVRLFDHGMYSRARSHFEDVASARFDADRKVMLCFVMLSRQCQATVVRWIASLPTTLSLPSFLRSDMLMR